MNPKTITLLAAIITAVLILLGAAAILVCVIFMFSNDPRDIMGAGLGFAGGTVLVGSGTIALAIISTRPFTTLSSSNEK